MNTEKQNIEDRNIEEINYKPEKALNGAAKKKISSDNAFLILSIILLPVAILLFSIGKSCAADAFKKEFTSAVEQNRENTYSKFYDTAYNKAEALYHTKNSLTISVDNIKETAVLEVLAVNASDVKEYRIDNELTENSGFINWVVKLFSSKEKEELTKDGAVIWLQGSCTGIFTIDLYSAETIVDNENHYVLVRVPRPSLTTFDTPDFEIKYFNNNTGIPKLLNGSSKIGLEAAIEDTADMTENLHDMIYDNDEYRQKADKSAKMLIENLVRGINPEVPDLVVEVEYYS